MRLYQTLFLLATGYALWLILMLLEIYSGYSGWLIQAVYAISFFALFVALWLNQRRLFAQLQRPWLEFVLAGSLTMGLVLIFYIISLWSYLRLANWLK